MSGEAGGGYYYPDSEDEESGGGMNKASVSYKQGYDQGFSDAICCEDSASGMWAETDSERDWMDGYYEGHVAGESARLGPGAA